MKKLLLSSVALAIVAACSPTGTTDGEAENAAVEMAGTPELGAWGFDLAGMNTEIAPGDDFNQYANGTWLETEEMPSDLSRYGMFTVLHLEAEEQVKEIITDLGAVDAAAGTVEQQVGDLYGSWMDTETIEQRGLAPAQPFLDEIAAAESHADISALFATIHHQSPFGVGIIPDPADTTRYTVFVGTGRSRPARP